MVGIQKILYLSAVYISCLARLSMQQFAFIDRKIPTSPQNAVLQLHQTANVHGPLYQMMNIIFAATIDIIGDLCTKTLETPYFTE